MGNGCKVESDDFFLTKGLHLPLSEVCAVVADDAMRVAESKDYLLEEFGRSFAVKFLNGLDFYPFGELVDCDQEVRHASTSRFELTHHVHPPDDKGPCQWYGFQSRCG